MLAVTDESVSDSICFRKDIDVIRRVLKTGTAGPKQLESFTCVAKHLVDLSVRLRRVFQTSATPISMENRIAAARQVLGDCFLILATLEPDLIDFRLADAQVHISGSVFELKQAIRDFRDLVEQKDEQLNLMISRLGSEKRGAL